MNFTIERASLLQSLQRVIGVISRQPRFPILSHVLLEVKKNFLFLIVTDLEIEVVVRILLNNDEYVTGSVAVSGRKLFEIFRNFSEYLKIVVTLEKNTLIVRSGSSSFSLSTITAVDFPKLELWQSEMELVISRVILKEMIEITKFAMATKDMRYYLNGMFFEFKEHTIQIVATDGHRLATCITSVDILLPSVSIIIPRKAIFEILQLLNISEELINIKVNNHSVRVNINNYTLTAKLIDAVFPNYRSVFPSEQSLHILEVMCDILKHALKRVAILANERFRIVQFILISNKLKITAHNFENEVSEEVLEVIYIGKDLEIFFNVDYLLDVINVVKAKSLRFFLTDAISSVKIEGVNKLYDATYIVMPICM